MPPNWGFGGAIVSGIVRERDINALLTAGVRPTSAWCRMSIKPGPFTGGAWARALPRRRIPHLVHLVEPLRGVRCREPLRRREHRHRGDAAGPAPAGVPLERRAHVGDEPVQDRPHPEGAGDGDELGAVLPPHVRVVHHHGTAVPGGVLVGGSQGSFVFRREDVLDPRSGHVLGHARVDVELISGDQPFWF